MVNQPSGAVNQSNQEQIFWNKEPFKWFNDAKGFGFIIRQNGEEAFAHFSDIVAKGHRNLTTGQRVDFEVVDNGPKGQSNTDNRDRVSQGPVWSTSRPAE